MIGNDFNGKNGYGITQSVQDGEITAVLDDGIIEFDHLKMTYEEFVNLKAFAK